MNLGKGKSVQKTEKYRNRQEIPEFTSGREGKLLTRDMSRPAAVCYRPATEKKLNKTLIHLTTRLEFMACTLEIIVRGG